MKFLKSALLGQRAVFHSAAVLIALSAFLCPCVALGQEADVARDLANPFANLWSIVNQINLNQLKGGPFREAHTQVNWNIQPVMPIPLNGQFNIVNRPVIPFFRNPYIGLTQYNPYVLAFTRVEDSDATVDWAQGLGDCQLASLLTPNKADGIIYGIGVTMIAPTSRDSRHIGQGLWQAGPAAGLFYVSKKIVTGVFPQHWTAVSGVDDEHPGTRFTNLQYAFAYLPTSKLTISTSNNILIDWTKDEANRWTVPVGIGFSYLLNLGKLPVSVGINYQRIVKHPEDIPHQESIVRFTITPVLPSPFAKKD